VGGGEHLSYDFLPGILVVEGRTWPEQGVQHRLGQVVQVEACMADEEVELDRVSKLRLLLGFWG
jgi:hypothetical protein